MLAAGRDVVVDKPFATTLERASSLVEFAKSAAALLTVYQNRRFDGDFQAIRQLVAAWHAGSHPFASKQVTTDIVRS